VTLNRTAATMAIFNPMTGARGRVHARTNGNRFEVYLQLKPHEAVVLQGLAKPVKEAVMQYLQPASGPAELRKEWTVSFPEGGPVLPPSMKVTRLSSWTEWGNESLRNFSGIALYKTEFTSPVVGLNEALQLDLGDVKGSAAVTLNGRKLATLPGPDFTVLIPRSLLLANNVLEIEVASLMANRIAYMDRNAQPWKIFYNTNMPARKKENAKDGIFDASGWKPLPSGILGPVTLTIRKLQRSASS